MVIWYAYNYVINGGAIMSYEKTIEQSTVYEGIIVNVRRDKAELVNGSIVGREVVEHPGGVTIIPVDADETVWCVRQTSKPSISGSMTSRSMTSGTHSRARRRRSAPS